AMVVDDLERRGILLVEELPKRTKDVRVFASVSQCCTPLGDGQRKLGRYDAPLKGVRAPTSVPTPPAAQQRSPWPGSRPGTRRPGDITALRSGRRRRLTGHRLFGKIPGVMEARILRHWLLSGVPKDQLAPILANAQAVRFLPGEVVFEEGDPADGVYLISTGAMDVTATDEQGRVVLARISADDVLGEMGVLDGQPRSGTATADEHCTAYFVPRERFVEALRGSPALCTRLLALLA